MLSRVRVLVMLIASLVFAAPALAQEPQPDATVGQGQVITDIATEVEPPPGEDDGTDIPPAVDDGTPAPEPQPDATGRRGEIHVLDSATSSSPTSAAPAATPSPAAVPDPAPAAATPARSAATAKTLPFTGVDAAPLALIGLALVAAGAGLLAVLRKPVK
jgi:cytoskeletal protein RodZ